MSGDDGIGYYTYTMANPEADVSFFSEQWLNKKPVSTMEGELRALETFLCKEGSKYCNSILVWISDSISGVYAVLKGRCKESSSYVVLEHILSLCDSHRLLLVAIWVPRELNEVADYLSHLSVLFNRERVEGTGPELEAWLKKSPT
jgi:hypothetical protein